MKTPRIYVVLLVVALLGLQAAVIAYARTINKPQPSLIYGERPYFLVLGLLKCGDMIDEAEGVQSAYAYPVWLVYGTSWSFTVTSMKPSSLGMGYDIEYLIDYCNRFHDTNTQEVVGEIIVVLVYN